MRRRTMLVTCLAVTAFAQQGTKKKEFTLRGKVEAVNVTSGTLTVNHGNVQGWMDAMTMAYQVDKPKVLKTIKAGDQIRAMVYDGDMKLHNVQVLPGEKTKK